MCLTVRTNCLSPRQTPKMRFSLMKSWGLSSGKVLSLPVFQSCVVLLYPKACRASICSFPDGPKFGVGAYMCVPGRYCGLTLQRRCLGVCLPAPCQVYANYAYCPKNERDIVKPTVNICAAVIFLFGRVHNWCRHFHAWNVEQGSVACKRCAIGDYQDERGQGACKSCPPGTTTLGFGPLVYLHIEHKDCTLKVPRRSSQRASHKCVLS